MRNLRHMFRGTVINSTMQGMSVCGGILKQLSKSSVANERGFTLIEIVIACAVFPIIMIGISNAFLTVRNSYTTARQLNEIYAVLSACPEMDRALEYNSLTNTTNCFPNNTFKAEGGSGNTISYSPNLTVSDTASLTSTDPLKTIQDSKVININVNFPKSSAPALTLKMLVTRNGIGQL